MRPPLAISTGDPGGVGPEIAARAMLELNGGDRVLLFGDGEVLRDRLGALGLAARCVASRPDSPLRAGEIGVVHAATWGPAALQHRPSPEGGRAQLSALRAAADAVMSGNARALVTAPISKAAVNLGGDAFVGHTEYLADRAGLAEDAVTMMFLGPRLRVALVTTHLAIRSAPEAVSQQRVVRTVIHLGQALLQLVGGADGPPPHIWVSGLNPHAGEGGLFGDEELCAVEPALQVACQRSPFVERTVTLEGPIGAETAFRLAADAPSGGVVAMLHDQATIASKLLDWGRAVNVTWGLPFVRTSVDHGVAYDAARDGGVDSAGMCAAIRTAQALS